MLWLLTPWWARRDLLLVRAHLTAVWAVLGSVVLGLLVAPGLARGDGRLAGVVWPIPPTQVGHYAAVAIGLTTVLWLSGNLLPPGGRPGRWWSRCRSCCSPTPGPRWSAMVAGMLIAGLSLFTARSRVRKAFAAGLGVVLGRGADLWGPW